MAEPTGVVVMAYGTPPSPDAVEEYYTHIRRGRPPTPEQLADLRSRYAAIGGISPLLEKTEAQRLRLESALEDLSPGRFRVVLGQKHASPFIEDAVAELAGEGIGRVVGLVLAPHYSAASVGQYQERLAAAATERGMTAAAIDSWHQEPSYLDFLRDAVIEALPVRTVGKNRRSATVIHGRTLGLEGTKVLFTAHSLPERVLVDDPYVDQLTESATEVAAAAGLDRWAGWSLCWQSAGRTPEPWRGPDILEVIDDLAATGKADGVLVCPQGFVSDHLEVLYDLDIEARQRAEAAGLAFARTRVLNDHAPVFEALARRVLVAATP